MSTVKLNGAVKDITPSQYKFIASVLQKLGFDGATALVETVGEGGAGFMAIVKKITVKKEEQVFKAIVKLASTVEHIRQTMDTETAFVNEHVMYTEVLPKFAELEEKAGIEKSERLRFAKCYGSSIELNNEVIILEDLTDVHFAMLDKNKPLSNDNVKQVLRALAKLHSLAYALKNLDPETYVDFERRLINFGVSEQNINKMKYMSMLFEQDILSLFEDEKYKNAFKGRVSRLNHLGKEANETDLRKHSIIKHGDAWTNNFMFLVEDNQTSECCMIDYQTASSSNPVTDIIFMIFNSTDHESRSQHFHDWISYYHTELGNHLLNFGFDVNFIYSIDQLNYDLKRHAEASLAHISIMSFFYIRESSDASKLKDAMKDINEDDFMKKALEDARIANVDENTKRRYKTKMEGVVDSFVELGFISI